MPETATAPDGVVHFLKPEADDLTLCGISAVSWSRYVTDLQRMGLVVYCETCSQTVLASQSCAAVERELATHVQPTPNSLPNPPCP